MQTETLERTLRDALRETLDREVGPHPAWTGSPAARRVEALERRRRWPLRELAVAAVLSAAGGVALLAGASNQPTTSMWPQTTLEEVREAQKLADAGDPRYTWQVSPDRWGQPGQHHPMSTEFFARFLNAELGWETARWDEAFAHPEGLGDGDVVFIRCGPGITNPLYPDDPEAGCAPTIDELRYETVKVTVAQLDREGASGIWVVTGWEMAEPVAQADPRVVEAEATALLEAGLQARIDGAGAEEFADFPADEASEQSLVAREIPLLYATSTGARYERSEFEIVEGPVWPTNAGMRYAVRLFAQGGDITVEQHFSLDWDDSGRVRLVYDLVGSSGGRSEGTTENGKAVLMKYGFLDGALTYRAADPLGPILEGRSRSHLAIGGIHPNDSAPREVLAFLVDPQPVGSGCVDAPAPADVEALARIVTSDPRFDGTAPVAVTIGGLPALQMDGVGAQVTACGIFLQPVPSAGRGNARLYLVDLPGGSAQVLAIAISGDDDSFETLLEWAAPVIDSIEFHVP